MFNVSTFCIYTVLDVSQSVLTGVTHLCVAYVGLLIIAANTRCIYKEEAASF